MKGRVMQGSAMHGSIIQSDITQSEIIQSDIMQGRSMKHSGVYPAVATKTGVATGAKTPVLMQSEV